MKTTSLLVILLTAGLALQCGGTKDQTKKPAVTSDLSPQEMIAAIEAIDQAKEEKKGGAVLDDYQQRSQANPKDLQLRFLYYYAMGDRDAAWQRINGMTFNEPDFPWPYLGRALIYDAWGSTLDKAEADYLKFLQSVPDIVWVYRKLGNLALRREFHDDAIKFFEQAIALDPSDPESHFGLALARWYSKDIAGAKAAMRKAAEADPNHFQARYQLGILLSRQKDVDGALAAFAEAAKVDPKHYETRIKAAKLLEGKGDQAGAIAQYEAALAARPADLDTILKVAAIYRELGDQAKELRFLEQAREIDPENADVLESLAALYLKKGDRQQAEGVLKQVVKYNPADATAQLELARIAAWREDWIQAIDRYILLLDNHPENPEGKQEYAALVAKLGVPAEGFTCQLKRQTFDTCLEDILNRRIRPFLLKRFREYVEQSPGTRGLVEIKLRVDKDGQVRAVRFVENQLKGRGFDALIYGCFWAARFPSGPGGEWSYEMDFQP